MAEPGSVAEALTVVRLHPSASVAFLSMPARGTQLGLEHTTKPTFFFGGFDGRATVWTICVGTVEYLATLAWAAAVESDDAVEAVAAGGRGRPRLLRVDVLALLAQAAGQQARNSDDGDQGGLA